MTCGLSGGGGLQCSVLSVSEEIGVFLNSFVVFLEGFGALLRLKRSEQTFSDSTFFLHLFCEKKKVSFCGFPHFYQDDLENEFLRAVRREEIFNYGLLSNQF